MVGLGLRLRLSLADLRNGGPPEWRTGITRPPKYRWNTYGKFLNSCVKAVTVAPYRDVMCCAMPNPV